MKKLVWVAFLPSSCTHTFPLQVFFFFLSFLGFSRFALIREEGGIFITVVNIGFKAYRASG